LPFIGHLQTLLEHSKKQQFTINEPVVTISINPFICQIMVKEAAVSSGMGKTIGNGDSGPSK
jgi:hypothetical protein